MILEERQSMAIYANANILYSGTPFAFIALAHLASQKLCTPEGSIQCLTMPSMKKHYQHMPCFVWALLAKQVAEDSGYGSILRILQSKAAVQKNANTRKVAQKQGRQSWKGEMLRANWQIVFHQVLVLGCLRGFYAAARWTQLKRQRSQSHNSQELGSKQEKMCTVLYIYI